MFISVLFLEGLGITNTGKENQLSITLDMYDKLHSKKYFRQQNYFLVQVLLKVTLKFLLLPM